MPLVVFFQAEDGIRDLTVTGVQTCALPIFAAWSERWREMQITALNFIVREHDIDSDEFPPAAIAVIIASIGRNLVLEQGLGRSEERRVGKECRSRWSPYH